MPDTHEPQASGLSREAAHEFRSHLNALLLSLELLDVSEAAIRRDAVSVVRRRTQALLNLVDKLTGNQRAGMAQEFKHTGPRAGTRVLVVEDEYLMAQTVADHLTRARCEVVGPVGTVEDALQALQAPDIDCALVDANLDGQFSVPVVEALTARGVRMAILSGYDKAALPRELQHVTFLQKPVTGADLLVTVAKLSACA